MTNSAVILMVVISPMIFRRNVLAWQFPPNALQHTFLLRTMLSKQCSMFMDKVGVRPRYLYALSMTLVRTRLSEAQRWQIIGMSCRAIWSQLGHNHTVNSHLPQRDDRAMHHLVRYQVAFIMSRSYKTVASEPPSILQNIAEPLRIGNM